MSKVKEPPVLNPHAIHMYCDGAMDYKGSRGGGVGYIIEFPSELEIENIEELIGGYSKTSVKRLELEAICQGMKKLIEYYKENAEQLRNYKTVTIFTDHHSINDEELTDPYTIRGWRKNKWKNHEGKPIHNHELLNKLDKLRTKLINSFYCRVRIKYLPEKFNRKADKLTKIGKKLPISNESISFQSKPVKRRFSGKEIEYSLLNIEAEYIVHPYYKKNVQEEWLAKIEICDGEFKGRTIKLYISNEIQIDFHRHHYYKIKLRELGSNFVRIYEKFEEVDPLQLKFD